MNTLELHIKTEYGNYIVMEKTTLESFKERLARRGPRLEITDIIENSSEMALWINFPAGNMKILPENGTWNPNMMIYSIYESISRIIPAGYKAVAEIMACPIWDNTQRSPIDRDEILANKNPQALMALKEAFKHKSNIGEYCLGCNTSAYVRFAPIK